MSKSETLLLEIGTEELPALALASSVRQLGQSMSAALKNGGLSHGNLKTFATPRRLAVSLEQVPVVRSGSSSLRMGPPVAAARKEDGSWSPAAQGFARSCGADVSQLEIANDGRLDRVACKVVQPEQQVADILPDMVRAAVAQLRFARSMRWGTCEQAFLRPVRWLLLIHGSTGIELSMFGISSSAHSYGHRQHHPEAIKIEHADEWQNNLREAKVIACMEERLQDIQKKLIETANEFGCTVDVNMLGALLDEVNGLVEWPTAIYGSFDKAYLQLPEEILLSVMQKHQRYFPLHEKDAGGMQKLAPAFIAISGIESSDPNLVRQGYENVLRARLSDAEFFWKRDCKRSLEDIKPKLENIIFHSKLGSVAERSRQIGDTAAAIADKLGADVALARRAGELCKCDLVSETVGEFPELQGVIGGLLAKNDGEELDVVHAIAQHYKPGHTGDSIPDALPPPSYAGSNMAFSRAYPVAIVLALADKLNLVAGIYSVGEMPTADKDPFAVRRAAIGVLRILMEPGLNIALPELLDIALKPFACAKPTSKLMEFLTDRLRAMCIEKGDAPQIVDAVLAVAPDSPRDVRQRIAAMQGFSKMPQAVQLIAAHKRVRNILRQAKFTGAAKLEQDKLIEPAERTLAKELDEASKKLQQFSKTKDYASMLKLLADVQPEVDEFFDKVKVMDDDPAIRSNRLALLSTLMGVFAAVADLTKLDG